MKTKTGINLISECEKYKGGEGVERGIQLETYKGRLPLGGLSAQKKK
jgi:hypothetical protein